MTDTQEAKHGRRWGDRTSSQILLALQFVVTVVAICALIIAVVGLLSVTKSRRDSARDTCQFVKGLVLASTVGRPASISAAQAYIDNTALRDCDLYARKVVK